MIESFRDFERTSSAKTPFARIVGVRDEFPC